MDRDEKLDEIITAYLKTVEAGERIDQAEWLTRYPDLAGDLAEFFASQRSVERVAAPLRTDLSSPLEGEESAVRGIADAATLPPTTGDAPASAAPIQPGDKIRYFGDYEILEEIARGGMGVVYKARHVRVNRIVALKMILAGQLASASDVERFIREAEATASLDHPNLVPIYEIGVHEGQHFFSMKLIDGASLARRVATFVGDPKAAVRLLIKVARAVHDAHQHGFLHRDLKPSNVLLDAQGEPYVGDFGLSRPVNGWGQPLTKTGNIVGTPSYMAPEQARSEKSLTTAVDVYGLGAIFYELLTGRPPFRAENELETILQVLDRDPPRPRAVNARVDADLETICLKCLEKEPKNRYNSALALAEDLERWLTGHAIQARPSGPVKKAWKWAKRNPTLAILLIVLPLWYFNVRLPWNWAWLQWAWYGLIALALTPLPKRLVVLCGRAFGKFQNIPLDFVNDGFLLPGALLALGVLCFYPGELAARRSAALDIVLISLMLGFSAQWFWRRRRAGGLMLALRLPLPIVIVFGLFPGLMVIDVSVKMTEALQSSETSLAPVCSSLNLLSASIMLFLMLTVGIEFRSQGCVTFFRFARWEEFESYEWTQPTLQYLSLRLNFRKDTANLERLPLLKGLIVLAKKEAVDQVLTQHVPERGPGNTTVAVELQAPAPRERQPAERVRDVAFLLMLSAMMQIAGSVSMMVPLVWVLITSSNSIQGLVAVLAFLFLGVTVAAGIVVGAAAVKMRKLIDLCFCRAGAILAMLPLGLGFFLGLPFGIWALVVLKRPDVQAAFAGSEHHGA